MKKHIIISFLLLITNLVYTQRPWKKMDGYGNIPISKGFVIGLLNPKSFFIPYDKITPNKVERFTPYMDVNCDTTSYISLWFDFTKKQITIFDEFKNEVIDIIKITKSKKMVGNKIDLGEFYVKGKKGKDRYYFIFKDTEIEHSFYMVYKHKDYSFTNVTYDKLPMFNYKTDKY